MAKTEVDLIIKNTKQTLTVAGYTEQPAAGAEMQNVGILENASIAISNGRIVAVGKSGEILAEYSGIEEIDASHKVVTPGFVDAHTHLVFAGSREDELEMKIKGATYLDILRQGEGILRTVRETRTATKEELLEICRKRSETLIAHGTTTAEAKSGYGLTLDDEIKSLEVINELNNSGPTSLVPTFLGAHAVPPEFAGRVSDYVDMICEKWIPEIASRKLATFCDVFCEKGVFEIEDSKRILGAGKRGGMQPKIHADELYPLGGAELAAKIGAVSADHLLFASAKGLRMMKRAGVIAVLLPGAPLTLMMEKYPDARGIISEGVPVALGSDLSPSCWLENFQLVIALACYKLKMTPAEAMTAATVNAAHAIRKAHEIGSIEVGKKADLLIVDANDYRFLGYRLGTNLVSAVVKNGKLVA